MHALVKTCTGRARTPPTAPTTFAQQLEEKHFTNGRTDQNTVKDMYEKAFRNVMETQQEFVFQSLAWHKEEIETLSDALPWTKKLKILNVDQGLRRYIGF